MNLHFAITFLSLTFGIFSMQAQMPTARQILEKSIAYHDPNNSWNSDELTLDLLELRPKGKDRYSSIIVDNAKGETTINRLKGKDEISRKIQGERCLSITVNGLATKDTSLIQKYHLHCNYSKMLRNYYTYLWGLPMKLKDPDTIIHKEVQDTTFLEQPVYGIKVTYDAEVGGDIWYFYFDKKNYALSGYRFYHQEADNDGEYISLQGIVEKQGLRLPQIRKWYTHKADKYLGADILMSIK